MRAIVYPSKLKGEQIAPASKSSMQRACAAALLHIGDTLILNPGHSNDDIAAIDVIQKLGATVQQSATQIKVSSKGVQPIGPEMNCGESGLGIRMFTPIAALSSNAITINGNGSLLKRPLKPATIKVDGSLSSQFLTGLLMAYAASNAQNAVIYVLNLKSKPYIDLTLAVLNSFGWKVIHNNYESFEFLAHAPLATHIEYTVEGDWSGAAFLLVAGAIAGPIKVKGLQLDSTQADKAVMQALKTANAPIEIVGDGIIIGANDSGAALVAFEFDATDCPDLFPPLVALAAVCKGVTIIKGVSRLAHKESDRGLTLQTEFAKLGIDIQLEGDLMKIYGGEPIHAATVFSQHDHRIAMACGVAALNANGPVIITEAEAINKSYTDFFDHLAQLGAKVEID